MCLVWSTLDHDSGSESVAGSVPALAVCMCLVWSTLDHDSGSESLAGSDPALAVCMCVVWSSLDHDSGSESLAGSVPALAVCMCLSQWSACEGQELQSVGPRAGDREAASRQCRVPVS